MSEELTLSRPRTRIGLGKAIKDSFKDGEWHRLQTIVAKVDASEDEVTRTLHLMREKGNPITPGGRRECGGVSGSVIRRRLALAFVALGPDRVRTSCQNASQAE